MWHCTKKTSSRLPQTFVHGSKGRKLIVICGATGLFARLMQIIPHSLAAAMLVCFAFFLDSYNGSLGGDGNINFFPAFKSKPPN